jgi:nucleotide-binding universal stress UspA family protein
MQKNEMKKILNFERILCPVAESHEADEGLQYTIALARSYGASLFILTIEESSAISADSVAAMRAAINRAVEHSIVLFPGVDHSTRLNWKLIVAERTRPDEAIIREAEAQNIDLIVMSSRRRPYAAKLLGSTAETISGTAPCPVLVTRLGAHHSASAIGAMDFKKLLVATDFSSDSDLALRYGLSLAQEYQSELHLLHVLTDSKTKDTELTWSAQSEEGPYHEAARRLHQSVPAEAHLWSEVTHVVREGKAHREIVSYAAEREIDLICIGAHGQGSRLGALFGSNADRVLRESPCPVLVARPLKPGAEPIAER